VDGLSAIGGGSLPGETLSTSLISLTPSNATDLATEFRAAATPVVARIQDGQVMLDLRTVLDDGTLVRALTDLT
jgi:L-seryl-tRNA(Ser) seleniumtransferase